MSDFRQTAIDAILEDLTFDSVKELRAYVSKNKQDDYFYGGILYAINAVQDLPSAQPERTGKWIEYDNSHCECPFCHEEWSYFDNEVECFNYCPNCGARMEGNT